MKKITKKILKKRENKLKKRNIKNSIKEWKLQVIERDNWTCQKCLNKLESRKQCQPHHIISLLGVKRNYPQLLKDINNGILLCYFCHKASPSSPHQGALEFILWLEKNKPEQYKYLKDIITTQSPSNSMEFLPL